MNTKFSKKVSNWKLKIWFFILRVYFEYGFVFYRVPKFVNCRKEIYLEYNSKMQSCMNFFDLLFNFENKINGGILKNKCYNKFYSLRNNFST